MEMTRPKSATSSISRAAVKRSSNPLAGCHWKGSSQSKQPPVMLPDGRTLDQGQVSRRTRGGHRRLEQQWQPVQIADGRRVWRRPPRLRRQCRNGLRWREGREPDAEAQGRCVGDESVWWQGCTSQEGRNALVEAGTGG